MQIQKACIFGANFSIVRQDSLNGAAWCATEVDPAGNVVYNSWGDCSVDSCPLEEGPGPCDTIGGPSEGRPCVFPFTVRGVSHTECITGQVETSCSEILLWGIFTVKTCKVRRDKLRPIPDPQTTSLFPNSNLK